MTSRRALTCLPNSGRCIFASALIKACDARRADGTPRAGEGVTARGAALIAGAGPDAAADEAAGPANAAFQAPSDTELVPHPADGETPARGAPVTRPDSL